MSDNTSQKPTGSINQWCCRPSQSHQSSHETLNMLQQIGDSSVNNHPKQSDMQAFFFVFFFVNELSKGKSAKD